MSSTYRMKVNDDGTVTTTYGDITKTSPIGDGWNGRMKLRLSIDANGPGHDMHTADNGTKTTLTCSCDEFTAVIEGGTEDSRQAEAVAAHHQHINRTDARSTT